METDGNGGEEKEEKEQAKALKTKSYQKIVKKEKKVQDKLDNEEKLKSSNSSELEKTPAFDENKVSPTSWKGIGCG